jgi:hypothetical protein
MWLVVEHVLRWALSVILVIEMSEPRGLDQFVRRLCVGAIGASLLAVSATIAAASLPPSRRWLSELATPRSPQYRTARDLGLAAGLYAHTPLSIVLVASADCPAFQRSIEGLRAIFAGAGNTVGVSLVSDREIRSDVLGAIGLPAQAVHVYERSALAVRVVPTLLVLDREGNVRFTREGEPRATDQEEIARVIERLSPSVP